MQRLFVLLAVVVLGGGSLAIAACFSRAQPPEPFTIVWNYDTSGYLETCGCSTHQLGGLARRAWEIDQLRQKQPLVALEGAHFIADAGEFQLFKGETVIAALNLMDYDAAQLGVREAQHGVDGLRDLAGIAQFPCFSANLELNGQPWDPPGVMLTVAGTTVAVTGVSQPALADFELPPEVDFADPDAALKRVVPDYRRQADLLVICLEGEETWIQQMLEDWRDQADLFLTGDRNEATARWQFEPDPPRLNNWDLGRQLGVISVDPLPTGYNITGTLLPLRDDLPADAAVLAYLEDTYRPQLKERFFANMKTDLEQLYLPPETCWGCHEQAYDSYIASGHSQALKTLYDRNQLYNPDCMGCHVVYDANLDELMPMNCVACHTNITEDHLWDAPKGGHVRPDPPVAQYTYEWCSACHDELNSTPFAEHWPQYVKRIYHGGDMSAAEAAAERMGLDIDAEWEGH